MDEIFELLDSLRKGHERDIGAHFCCPKHPDYDDFSNWEMKRAKMDNEPSWYVESLSRRNSDPNFDWEGEPRHCTCDADRVNETVDKLIKLITPKLEDIER